jgi:hypothetical protein
MNMSKQIAIMALLGFIKADDCSEAKDCNMTKDQLLQFRYFVSTNKFMKASYKTWWDKNKPDNSDGDGENEGDDGDGRDTTNLPYVTQKSWP